MSRFISIGIIRLSTKNGYPRIQELTSESETFCQKVSCMGVDCFLGTGAERDAE
ncbi:MAG: hypothetical protein V7K53_31660 [Nostoc sp.]|uniref:hypothetical protein n=1 Tax=Nostoc sp. TaxID=1180 RepID=UPI002FF7B3FF